MCAFLAALPLLLCSSSYSCCCFLCLSLNVWCVREAGETYPLHAGSSWHVSDGNVRHWRTWRLMAVYSSVCASECSVQKEEVGRVKERQAESNREGEIMLRVPLHHRGRLFPPHHYSSVNLGLPIKRDHTANMKYTLCVERLIKYWLQTYMNLPHQIEAAVGGLPLIRCVWYGNESRKQQGLLCTTHFLCC